MLKEDNILTALKLCLIPYIYIKCYTNNKKSSIGGVGKVTDRTQGKLSPIGQVWELDG